MSKLNRPRQHSKQLATVGYATAVLSVAGAVSAAKAVNVTAAKAAATRVAISLFMHFSIDVV